MEWLLPWWWARYSTHNDHPVAFVDLGMSRFGKAFCHDRGEVVALEVQACFKEHPANALVWEELFGKEVWQCRTSWFKKPFAFLHTPFEKTLWLDLDCEVLKNLAPLFEYSEFAIVQDPESAHEKERSLGAIQEGEIIYNSGVILYPHGSCLIEKWVEATLKAGDQFCSDQHILSRVIFEEQITPLRLDPSYNWRMTQGINMNAAIIHWVGSWGKAYIRRYGGLAENPLYQALT